MTAPGIGGGHVPTDPGTGLVWGSDGAGSARPVLLPRIKQAQFLKGFNYFVGSSAGMSSAQGLSNIATVAAAGADRLAIVPVWFMANATDTTITAGATSPTDASIIAAATAAKAAGMAVTLKPHVNVTNGTWRGAIAPSVTADWFTAYTTFITHYAALAEQIGAELFVVGVEYVSMTGSGNDAAWEAVVAAVRAVYSGPLTYAANHTSEALTLGWWSFLDYVGIDLYDAITSPSGTPNPGVATLIADWQASGGVLDTIERIYRKTQKPIILTEIGYYSRDDTASAPGVVSAAATSAQAQADAMDAALQVLGRMPHIKGLYWWTLDNQSNPALGNYAFIPTVAAPLAVVKQRFKADALGEKPSAPRASAFRVWKSADFSVVNSTLTTIGVDNGSGSFWDTVEIDTDAGMSLTAGAQKYVVSSAGIWTFGIAWAWAGNATGSVRLLQILKNGTAVLGSDKQFPNSTNSLRSRVISGPVAMVAGDYVQVQAQQDSGGSLASSHAADATPVFWGYRISP